MEENKIQEPNKGFNLSVDHFKMQLVNTINEAEMPVSITYYVLKDLMRDIENLYNKVVNNEYSEFSQASQEYLKSHEHEEIHVDEEVEVKEGE